ncbi:MAG: C25 family cysteine peptidase [Acidobacteriota bacterium]
MLNLRSWVVVGVALVAVAGPVAGDVVVPKAFKILVETDGLYRVDFEALAAHGLDEGASDRLELSLGGESVPIWLEDGGDGVFGAGDYLEFVGERLRGEHSWVHDFAWLNVYRLSTAGGGARVEMVADVESASPVAKPRVRRHLEEDALLTRLPGSKPGEDDPWFWHKLVHNRPEPTPVKLDLSGLDADGTVDLEIEVRGWSRPANKASAEVFDHALAVKVANHETGREKILGVESWNGTKPYRLIFEDADASIFGPRAELRLMVPMRKEAKEGRAVIDVILLNAVTVDYDHSGQVGDIGERLSWGSGDALRIEGAGELVAYGADGARTEALDDVLHVSGVSSAWVGPENGASKPAAVLLDRPSHYRSLAEQVDYVMVVPHPFREALEPLADLHRRRGLKVELVDVEDIYDEFNHGIAHPKAIRDFLAHANGSWVAPAPRFVLLVGDASWDVKNAEAVDAHYADWTYRRGESRDFAKNESTTYEGGTGRSRHFIPTWQTSTGQGHAASDNYFVDFDGDQSPEMAIGRLPVASVEELEPIIAKIKAYIEEPAPGDWRKDVLFVTNEQPRYQQHSDIIAEEMFSNGFTPNKIYPASSDSTNEGSTDALVDAIGSGQLLVHFIGHGGRYIWRTGPPDLTKNHDLFTLDDLDRLPRSEKLPVIVSLTCYSAPFDHPTADSIGEKFLRIEGRGAVGVIAASWRNSPSIGWGSSLMRELTQEGSTVGEALMRVKQEIGSRMFRETYLLLGDPALPVALPESLTVAGDSRDVAQVEASEGAAERGGR